MKLFWKVWNCDKRKWLGSQFETRKEAEALKTRLIGKGSRSALANFQRTYLRVCPVTSTGHSLLRDQAQSDYNRKRE